MRSIHWLAVIGVVVLPAGACIPPDDAESDMVEPQLTLPTDITADAPLGEPTVTVEFEASATDDVDGPVETICAPASGSEFPVGTTTVECSAVDVAKNTATGSFSVTVRANTTIGDGLTRQPDGVDGNEPNNRSERPSVSSDGRFVAFNSDASNLVAGDTNGNTDVFVYEQQAGAVRRQPLGIDSSEPNGRSHSASISGDGTVVAFVSEASNLVANDNNNEADVFVWNVTTGIVVIQPSGVGGDQPNDASSVPSISADGRFVAFNSDASNLVAGDNNGHRDVFLWSVVAGSVVRRPNIEPGDQLVGFSYANSISADGRFIAFDAYTRHGNENRELFVWDHTNGSVERQPAAFGGGRPSSGSWQPSISADGNVVAFNSDAKNLVELHNAVDTNVFVWDRSSGNVERQPDFEAVFPSIVGAFSASISGAGRYVAFVAYNYEYEPDVIAAPTGVFIWDRETNSVARTPPVDEGNLTIDVAWDPSISDDGGSIAFEGYSWDLELDGGQTTTNIVVWDV